MSPSKTQRRDSGSGGLYQDGRGLWTAVVELPPLAGKRRRKVIRDRDRAAAARKLRDLRKELDRAGDLPTSSPPLERWLSTWLEEFAARDLKPRTLVTYRGYIARYVVPAIGRIRLDKLTPDHVRALHTSMLDAGLSSTTTLQAHRILTKALNDAVSDGRVGRNVAAITKAPRKAQALRAALTVPEAVMLLRSVAGRDEGAHWAVALMAGLRQGERLGMTDEMLDLDAGILTVAWQLQRLRWEHGCAPRRQAPRCGRTRGGACPQRTVPIPPDQEARQVHGGLWLTRPKSRAGWRQVPLPEALWEILRRYRATHEPSSAGLVFHDGDGRPIDPSRDSKAWRDDLAAAGLPDVVLHSARHTANTLLHYLGVDDVTRQKIMGHSSAVVNAGYVHVADPIMREAMDRLGSAFFPQIKAPASPNG